MTGAWLPIIDTRTGETRMFWDDDFDPSEDSGSEYLWTEGNWSCDTS